MYLVCSVVFFYGMKYLLFFFVIVKFYLVIFHNILIFLYLYCMKNSPAFKGVS